MRHLHFSMLFFVALSMGAVASHAEAAVEDAIVKIYTVFDSPDYYDPWRKRGPRSSTGSGSIIKGNRILTNGHVVQDQTYLQVRRYGDAKRYEARLVAVSHDADLALLAVDDPTFFEGVEPLELGELPLPQDEVNAYGFPVGGDSLSITKGVISRVEHQTYSHSSAFLLAGQMDAAINPGNSGGPVIRDDKIVGVAMQGMRQADNIGYMVPVPVIKHFFKDLDDGTYDGFPSLGLGLQRLENPAMKASVGLSEEETGMLVTRIVPGSSSDGYIEEGDVVLAVDGHELADDGTVEFREKERTFVSYLVQKRQVGESIDVELVRDGEIMTIKLPLTREMGEDRLIPLEQYGRMPTYYIYGGVVFAPVTKNFLKAWGGDWYNKAPKSLVARLGSNMPEREDQEIVMALKVLAADINQGYHDVQYWVVESVNGQAINNLRELIHAVETSEEDFIEFKEENGHRIVLSRQEAEESRERILNTYRIKSDRSDDLKSEE